MGIDLVLHGEAVPVFRRLAFPMEPLCGAGARIESAVVANLGLDKQNHRVVPGKAEDRSTSEKETTRWLRGLKDTSQWTVEEPGDRYGSSLRRVESHFVRLADVGQSSGSSCDTGACYAVLDHVA